MCFLCGGQTRQTHFVRVIRETWSEGSFWKVLLDYAVRATCYMGVFLVWRYSRADTQAWTKIKTKA